MTKLHALTVCIFWGDIFFTYKFLEDQKVEQERSCNFVKKFLICPILPPMSDLAPFYGSSLLARQDGRIVKQCFLALTKRKKILLSV
jgi:hypothetical protein